MGFCLGGTAGSGLTVEEISFACLAHPGFLEALERNRYCFQCCLCMLVEVLEIDVYLSNAAIEPVILPLR